MQNEIAAPAGYLLMLPDRRIKGRHLVWDGATWVKAPKDRIGQRAIMVIAAARKINATDLVPAVTV